MGILDVLRVPVHACVSGEITGPALGVLASCPRRSGYPNASFVLAEPKLHFGGTVTALTAREQQMTRMLDTLYFRLAGVTGREVDQIRDDARRGRTLTTAQAIGYGLIQSQETAAAARQVLAARQVRRARPARPVPWASPALRPGRPTRRGRVAALVWRPEKIALCTRLLSIGNIKPRVIPYGRESVRIGTLWHFCQKCAWTGVCDEYRK